MEDVFFKESVAGDAVGGGNGLVVEGFGVDAIEAEELELAGADGGRGGFYETPVFIVEEAAFAGGKDEGAGAGVAEDEEFHVATEGRAEPLFVFTPHPTLMVVAPCEFWKTVGSTFDCDLV